jgi:hypothetical protein
LTLIVGLSLNRDSHRRRRRSSSPARGLSRSARQVGSPDRVPVRLVDSNLDWGQDLVGLRAWCRANAPGQPVGLAYHGQINPSIFGLINYFQKLDPIARIGHSLYIYKLSQEDVDRRVPLLE